MLLSTTTEDLDDIGGTTGVTIGADMTAGLSNDEIFGIASCFSRLSFFLRNKASLGWITMATRAKQMT